MPDLVICSSALRTRQTLELVAPGFGAGAEPVVETDVAIYAATATELLDRLRKTPDDFGAVMLIGHQPAIQDLALILVGVGAGLDRLSGKFPTGGLAAFDLDCGWEDLGPGGARFARMVRPKELERS